MTVRPDTDDYDDIELDEITLPTRDGASTRAILARPHGDGPFPAVVIGAEGTGLNTFIRRLAATFAHLGLRRHRARLLPRRRPAATPTTTTTSRRSCRTSVRSTSRERCTTCSTRSTTCRALPNVDASRVASWGYCTGGTIALFAPASAPTLPPRWCSSRASRRSTGARRPAARGRRRHAVEHRVPDPLPDRRPGRGPAARSSSPTFRGRSSSGASTPRSRVYPGAGHAFNAHGSSLYHEAADQQSWEDAIAFLGAQLHPAS